MPRKHCRCLGLGLLVGSKVYLVEPQVHCRVEQWGPDPRLGMVENSMNWTERFQSVFVVVAVVAGLAIGTFTQPGALGEHLAIPALLVMLTAVIIQLAASTIMH